EVIQNNAIFVPAKSPELLAKEIVRVLKDDNLRKNLIEQARNFIKRYTWDEVGKSLENLYFKLLE
ncbi:MAG: glycosyltransferase, partial [Candidatus Hodarchaeota archaeon]